MQKTRKNIFSPCPVYKVHVCKSCTTVNEEFYNFMIQLLSIWMCHNKRINNQINKLHGRTLRFLYNNKRSSSWELLETDKSRTIHERNIHILLTKIFKVKIMVAQELMKEISNSKTIHMI